VRVTDVDRAGRLVPSYRWRAAELAAALVDAPDVAEVAELRERLR
jgi:hypothetical protein